MKRQAVELLPTTATNEDVVFVIRTLAQARKLIVENRLANARYASLLDFGECLRILTDPKRGKFKGR